MNSTAYSLNLLIFSSSQSSFLNFSVVTVFFSGLWFLFGIFFYFLSPKILTLFMHYSPDHGKHLYDSYFEHFVKQMTYLHLLRSAS